MLPIRSKISSVRVLRIFIFAVLVLLVATVHPLRAADFAKGADVSWLPQMEVSGFPFENGAGVREDCLKILKENGINAVRLRVFVNPSQNAHSGHCSEAETVAMAVRAQGLGMRVMIDFHYSDSWADPGKQRKPAAWMNDDFEQLKGDVYKHTHDVMADLKAHGVVPEWVQVGNEISPGMLWPDGGLDHWPQLSALLNAGYDAVKEVDKSTKVVIHLDRGSDGKHFRDFFDHFKANGGKWDVIGMSYYPFWDKRGYQQSIDALAANMNDMAARYDKEVMICETGGEAAKPQETYDMLVAAQSKVKEVPGGAGLGVFYWEPEGAHIWSGYALSCWGDDGKPTQALSAFRDGAR